MPTYFQRPENALKRANEFIDVGKKQRALDALYDVIKSKKHRTWQKIHEPIMEKYLVLCVELKKSHVAKEGLYQYKLICQQVNIKSLEDVVRKYLALAEDKTEEARAQSHQAVVDIDDLDVIQTPESLLLSAVSGEDSQDRSDRAILTPWVKFLWESYRQCLDLLRNNSRVEKLYQDIAQQAFKFCLKYQRKTEFRKLCDNLRTHLGHIHKHQHQQTAINLNNPESQAMHLETRLVQLDSAIQMELWQEAFKAVEDIHGLISLSKKPPKPSLMANYYQKLGLVFWKAGNRLFHACALHRLFHLSREQRKNLSPEEQQKMASRVLCATLAVPILPSRNPIDQLLEVDSTTLEKQRRLATLLGLQTPPNRTALIKDLVKYSMLQHVHPEVQNLYRWLEVDFHPLKLSQRVASSMEYIENNEDLCQYESALHEITITRLLKQISQVYQTIEFARLAKLAPFANKFQLERVIVDSARRLELQIRIDHRTKSLSFGMDLGVAQKEDVPEGPYLQSMPSEQIRNQMTNMAQALHKAVNMIKPEGKKKKEEEIKEHIVTAYRQTSAREHQRILSRRQIIEDRKELLESLSVQREREELQKEEEIRSKAHAAEMARLEREAEERERQRRVEEQKEIQKKHAKERLKQLKETELGAKAFKDLHEEDIVELDADEILARQVEQLEKEKKELQERLNAQSKKVDHLARAKCLEEIPLLKQQYEEEKVKLREFWEQEEQERIEKIMAEREMALEHSDRLKRMMEDKDAFLKKIAQARMSVYKEKLAEFNKKLAEERKKRLQKRKEMRIKERRQKRQEEKEEAEQRAREEAMKREREEKERIEREQREEEERQYEEKMRKLEEIAEKQRQKEREIEEREAKRREEIRGQDDRGGDQREERGGAWRAPVRGGGWREREKERELSWKKRDDGDGGREHDWRRGEGPRIERDFRRDEPRDLRKDERGPDRDFRRDDRGPPDRDMRRDDRGPDRDFCRDASPRGGFGRGGDDGRPPARDDRDWGRRGDDRDWGRREPPRDDWRRGPPARDERDSRMPYRDIREEHRDSRMPARDIREERDGRMPARDIREDRDSRMPARDIREDRDFGRRDGPPRDDWRRGPPRDDRDGGGWRRGGDERGPPSRDDWGGRGGGRDMRGAGRNEEREWRRGDTKDAPSRDKRGDGDEWTTVKY
ncbi:eukaryotic translation initiation factor 3 subunit A [Lingula anatina]|uniref:Eukaryotic translation initiation factor 3 subunit A n=1 Tax=Lingula anatina TaxID=7574 RepID=A0A1S3GYG1_LINAN|nr:eukaryotic translation initiation factor 3 subunit A [Lingula anatina]|eukprot:XP_013378702.1 eukaryotic translation initiation factor 3 subunit A [Lingula anatina]